ncbi:MAG: recombinase family protein [Bacteroidetes bacterium]|nr:recombinase family protein [Bacteroidota bacterium]
MKTVLYMRVSDPDQNLARQEKELRQYAEKTGATEIEFISEKITGVAPLKERKLYQVLTMEGIERLVVEDVDRLGRDAAEVLTIVKELTAQGINLTVTRYGIDTILPNGDENPVAKMIFSIMSTLFEQERKNIKRKQRQGIEIAKLQGKYKGRKLNTTLSPEQLLRKYPKVVKELQSGTSIRRTAKLCDVSPTTVQNVKKAIIE